MSNTVSFKIRIGGILLFYFGKSSGRITIITYKYMTHCKEIQPVNPKGNQPWIFIGRTDVEAKAPIFWPRDKRRWLTGKYPDAGKDRRQEKEATEDETVGWHHWLNGHEFEQIPGDSEGQGSLVWCSPWGCKESDTTEWLNNKNDLRRRG